MAGQPGSPSDNFPIAIPETPEALSGIVTNSGQRTFTIPDKR